MEPTAEQIEFQEIFLSGSSLERDVWIANLTEFLEKTNLEALDFSLFVEVKNIEGVSTVQLPLLWIFIKFWEIGYPRPLEIILLNVSVEKLNAFNFNEIPKNTGDSPFPRNFLISVISYFINMLGRKDRKESSTAFLHFFLRLPAAKFQGFNSNSLADLLLIASKENAILLTYLFNSLSTFPRTWFSIFIQIARRKGEVIDSFLQRLSLSQLHQAEMAFFNKRVGIKEKKLLLYIHAYIKVKKIPQLLPEKNGKELPLAIEEVTKFVQQKRTMVASYIFHPLAFLYKEMGDFFHLEEMSGKLQKKSFLYLETYYELAHRTFCQAIEAKGDLSLMLKAFEYAIIGNEAHPSANLLSNIAYYYIYGEEAPLPPPQELALLSEQIEVGSEKSCLFLLREKKKNTFLSESKSESFSQKTAEGIFFKVP